MSIVKLLTDTAAKRAFLLGGFFAVLFILVAVLNTFVFYELLASLLLGLAVFFLLAGARFHEFKNNLEHLILRSRRVKRLKEMELWNDERLSGFRDYLVSCSMLGITVDLPIKHDISVNALRQMIVIIRKTEEDGLDSMRENFKTPLFYRLLEPRIRE